jgi:hypothetical protein
VELGVKILKRLFFYKMIVLMPSIKVILDVFHFLHFLFILDSLLNPYIIQPRLQEVDKKWM